jgi:hypothetical protein
MILRSEFPPLAHVHLDGDGDPCLADFEALSESFCCRIKNLRLAGLRVENDGSIADHNHLESTSGRRFFGRLQGRFQFLNAGFETLDPFLGWSRSPDRPARGGFFGVRW